MAQNTHKASLNGHVLAALMIALTAVITHAIIIPRLGYYYDDWYMLWSGASRGSQSLVSLFSVDRPLIGYIYLFLYRIIRDSIPGWHLLTLVVRIASGYAFYWIITLVWPGHKQLSVLSSMIFVVFPGFLAEPNAATKINHLIGYSAALFSIALTLQTTRTSKRKFQILCTVLSVFLQAVYVWIYEYMVGLEVMRLALLFWMQWRDNQRKGISFSAIKRLILAYIPYLLIVLLFLFWRVKIFNSTRDATDLRGLVTEYQGNFIVLLLRLVFQVVKDFLSTSIFAWFVQPYHLLAQAEYSQILWAGLAACIVAIIAFVFAITVHKPNITGSESESPWVMVIIGGLIALGAVFPVVLSNRFLDLMNAYKGYALHPSAGVMIAVMGVVFMLRPQYRKTALIILLGLSVMTNVLNNQVWANFWQVERNFWWQLTWRAPEISENTVLMAYLPEGYAFQQDYEIWGPVNLIYRQEYLSVPHIQAEVLNQDTLYYVLEGRVTDPYTRDIFLSKDFHNLLLVSQPSTDSCIHVIDGQMPVYSLLERPIVEKVGQFSNVDHVIPKETPKVPLPAIFSPEPQHNWCYYYEQAALARQSGNWGRISELFDTASAANQTPADRSEYFVFIEGLINSGRMNTAAQLFNNQIKGNPDLKYTLCTSISNAPNFPSDFGYQRDQIKQLICQ